MITATIDKVDKTVVIRGEVVTLRINVDIIEINPRKKVSRSRARSLEIGDKSPIAGWWRRMCPPGIYTGDQLYESFKNYCDSEGIAHVPEKRIFLAGRHHNTHIIKSNVPTRSRSLTIYKPSMPEVIRAFHILSCEENADNKLQAEVSIANLMN